jgi:hypothetical protein
VEDKSRRSRARRIREEEGDKGRGRMKGNGRRDIRK